MSHVHKSCKLLSAKKAISGQKFVESNKKLLQLIQNQRKSLKIQEEVNYKCWSNLIKKTNIDPKCMEIKYSIRPICRYILYPKVSWSYKDRGSE